MSVEINVKAINLEQNPSISSFNLDNKVPDVQKENRAFNIRRDNDTVLSPEIRIRDVEKSFKHYLVSEVNPHIMENNIRVDVPVVYSTPERWKTIQRDGFLRDAKGHLMAPVIAFRSYNITPRQDLEKNDILKGTQEGYQYTTQYSKQNRYSNFNILQNTKPVREIYTLQTPDYLDFAFEVIVWCDTKEHLDTVLESLLYYNGRGHGDTFKFVSRLQDIRIDITGNTGEDRLVRATIPYITKAYTALKGTDTELANTKSVSLSKVITILESS
jgi:hypothetical protein